MKKRQFIGAVLFLVAGFLHAQTNISLDEAIKKGVEEIEERLTRGVKIVVLNFRSPSKRFSDYVLDEMMTELVRNRKIIVVDRANLELIQQEMNFQMSGEVSDSSAQAIGQKLGAQSIVSGSIEDMGPNYRIRFRTIKVESAEIQVLSSFNVQKDAITNLMGASGATTASPSPSPSPRVTTPNELNFSAGRKVGAGVLNTLFGLGSFTMGDLAGGFIVGGLELAGAALFLIGLDFGYYEDYYDYYGYYLYSEWYWDPFLSVIGVGVYVVGAITGLIRPFTYDKSLAKKRGTYYSFEDGNPFYHISLAPVSTKTGMGMGVFYSMSY